MREAVCVLGVHRSGTTLVARVLDELGVYWGPREHLFGPRADNPDGFWEHAGFVGVNEEILARFGGSWHQPPAFPPGWERGPTLADLRARAAELVAQDFSDVPVWGWKDPRSCLTLPFWGGLLPAARYVVCLRSPLSVAHSLEARDGFPVAKSAGLWFSYLVAALRHTAGRPRMLVSYEELIAAPAPAVERLARFAGVTAGGRDAASRACASVRRELQHHRVSLLDTVRERAIPSPARALYLELHRLATGPREVGGEPDQATRALAALAEAGAAEQAPLDAVVADQHRLGALITELRADLARLEAELAGHQEGLARFLAYPVRRAYLGLRSALFPDWLRRA